MTQLFRSSLETLLAAAVLAAGTLPAMGQLRTPAASPRSVLEQTVGLTEVTVDYSRPSKKGREIYGGLVPFGEVWRTGANQPTKLSFSDPVTLGGKTIPAGTHALYTIPGKEQWTIIVYSETDLWGSFGYDSTKDVARFTATPQELGHEVETFTIGIGELRNDSATIYLDWDQTRVALPLGVPTEGKVMSQIEELKGTPAFQNPNTLFAAGTYYHESGKDLEQALAWVSQAVGAREDPAYWMYARKARIEADLGLTEAARASAEKTLELAEAGNNPDYQKIAKDILASL